MKAPSSVRPSRGRRIFIVLISAVVAFIVGVLTSYLFHVAPEPNGANAQSKSCVYERIGLLGLKSPDLPSLDAVSDSCYRQSYQEFVLNDFVIRRTKFLEQSRDSRMLLLVVVVITLAGVGLAGLQLFASFHLATTGRGAMDQANELSIEKDKVSLKSSVTGLVILVCSFAFFALFVMQVHPIREVQVADPPPPSPVARQIEAEPLSSANNALDAPVVVPAGKR